MRKIARRTRPADNVIVFAAEEASPGALLLLVELGLPRQRNAVIEAAADADIVVFFDHDFLPDPAYLAAIEQHTVADSRSAVATGVLPADGITRPAWADA